MRAYLIRLVAVAVMMAWCGVASAAFLASAIVRGDDDVVGVRWISVTLTNPGAEQGGELVLSSYSRTGTVEMVVPIAKLPSGATRTINLPVQLVDPQQIVFRPERGGRVQVNLDAFHRYGDARDYLLVSPPSDQATDAELDDFSRANQGGSPGMGHTSPSRRVYHSGGVSSSSGGSTTSPLLASERPITQMDVADLPENWLCYAPMKCVFISEMQEREISPVQRAALDTWVDLGGNLYFFDSESSSTEKRGLGAVWRVKENPVLAAESFQTMGKPLAREIYALPSASGFPYSTEEQGGRLFLVGLVVLFALLVGPINYMHYSRRGQIRKLLKTVPLVSLGFCGVIGVYFLLTEGFARKGGSLSMMLLNESKNQSLTFSQHLLVSGLYPSGGFHFGRETLLRTLNSTGEDPVSARLGQELVVTRGLFRPKIPFRYMTLHPGMTRERLLVNEDATSAQNGFELPAKAVAVYRDGKFYAGGSAASGAAAALKEVEPPKVAEPNPLIVDDGIDGLVPVGGTASSGSARVYADLIELLIPAMDRDEARYFQDQVRTLWERQPPISTTGTLYAVAFEGTPKGTQPGVEITDGKHAHLVLGVGEGQ